MAASVNNGHSEDRFEKPLMENGVCNFLARPMYKRRKVSAVRDFPEGCGPHALRIGPVLKVDIAGFGSDNVTIVEDKKGEFSGADNTVKTSQSEDDSRLSDLHAETLHQTIDYRLKKEHPMSSSHQVDGPMENTVTRRYFPRRKVSAVRDFPPLCGRDAQRGISDLNNKSVVQQKMTVDDDDPLKRVTAADVKEVENNIQDEYARKRKLADIDLADYEGNAAEEVHKLDVLDPSSRMTLQQENGEKYITLPEEINHHHVKINSKTVVKKTNGDAVDAEGTSGLEVVVYPKVQSPKPLQVASDKKAVLGLMAKSECPWRSDIGSSKFKLTGGIKESKGKKPEIFSRFGRSKVATRTKCGTNSSGQNPLKKKRESTPSNDMGQVVIWEKKVSVNPSENIREFQAVKKAQGSTVNVTPFGHRNLSGHENDSNVTRHKVRETLRLFQAVARKLLQEIEAKHERASSSKRVDLLAAKILKEKGKYVNTGKPILGHVPGVEVGDEFQYRVELNIIGLHRALQGGIDCLKHNGKVLATSIVASGGYADDLENSDVLIYTGQGGNVMNTDKEPEDQKLERGNLALKNSNEEQNHVRVIRGSESADGKCKIYVYDGMYRVESYWQDMGPHGKLVYKFRLRRIPGQPELALKELKKSKKFKTREGLCVADISGGKERIPVCAVNTIDNENPQPFTYITSMVYPDDCHLIPPKGCDCTDGCSESQKCACAVNNGGEIPFNHNGAIVEAKPLVYECGPRCKCPSTCHNRVSQHGIKFQLEIFKTNSRGWGVRSQNSIPSGSFICEYIGELLHDKEAEQRTGNDEYLFDIGNNCSNNTLWDGLSTLIPEAQSSSREVVKGGGFTIDAAQYGNVGRFVNHSCSPNLIAQDVLYDHHDKRMAHIMLFAAENIPPLQELTYDYNYMIGQVSDSDGNIKRKDCFCGSVECTGRMY